LSRDVILAAGMFAALRQKGRCYIRDAEQSSALVQQFSRCTHAAKTCFDRLGRPPALVRAIECRAADDTGLPNRETDRMSAVQGLAAVGIAK